MPDTDCAMQKIPKVIHYCWFGGSELPELERRCVDGWAKHLDGFEFRLWDESTFDLDSIPYVREAYDAGKFAFVSDVVRMYALVEYGGIYLDTDIELLGSLDPFLGDEAFSGYENRTNVACGVMGCVAGFPLFERMLDYYCQNHFVIAADTVDQTTIVQILSRLLDQEGYERRNEEAVVSGLHLYERQVFYPKKLQDGSFDVRDDTVTIHHGSASWLTEREKRRGTSLVWRNVFRPVLRSARDALNAALGEQRTRRLEASLRKRMR